MENFEDTTELENLRTQCKKLEKQLVKHLTSVSDILSSALDYIDANKDNIEAETAQSLGLIIATLGLQNEAVACTLSNPELSVQELRKAIKKLNKNPIIKVKEDE